jgi:hypothetical protein
MLCKPSHRCRSRRFLRIRLVHFSLIGCTREAYCANQRKGVLKFSVGIQEEDTAGDTAAQIFVSDFGGGPSVNGASVPGKRHGKPKGILGRGGRWALPAS